MPDSKKEVPEKEAKSQHGSSQHDNSPSKKKNVIKPSEEF